MSVLAKCSFTKVHIGVSRSNNEFIAVNRIKKHPENQRHQRYNDRESANIKAVDYKNTIRVLEIFDSPTHLDFVMEWMPVGSLQELQSDIVVFPEHIARIKICLILSRIEYEHRNKIVHRDIEPSNILINSEPRMTLELKITNFGLSMYLMHGKDS